MASPSSHPPLSSRDIIPGSIGGLISLLTALLAPEQLSTSARVALGVGVLVVLALGYGIYRLMSGQRKLRDQLNESQRQLNESQRNLEDKLNEAFPTLDYRVNKDRGIFLKGDNIPSVVLRVESVHRLIDDIVVLIPKENQNEALYEAGKRMGETFSVDLERAATAHLINYEDRNKRLKFWEEFDANAGMGRFDFSKYDAHTGRGRIILHNSFLSRHRSNTVMDHLMAGYFAGALNVLYEPRVDVQPCQDELRPHSRMEFEVSPQ